MQLHITIKGQTPSGKNHVNITASGRRYPTKHFAEWRDAALYQVKRQIRELDGLPIDEPKSVYIEYWAGDLRKRDAPGIIDALFHVLERVGVVADDVHLGGEHKLLQFTHKGLDRSNPRVEIQII